MYLKYAYGGIWEVNTPHISHAAFPQKPGNSPASQLLNPFPDSVSDLYPLEFQGGTSRATALNEGGPWKMVP